ncbi:MAG: site-2 protease family protein, partial [Actinomycetales bacterium]|nr:site-2 protease family protein [Actinomycetales bacterium]
MLEIVGIVIFALLIAASIALHEVGHLVPAKRFGVKVTEYMVGFGPTVWARLRGETSYGIKAIPLGGYIRMIGMLPPAKGDPDGTARSMTTGRFATMIDDARRASLEEVGPADADRVFYKLPVRKRIVIMLGGPLMNLLLAFVLFAIVLVGIGLPQPTTAVGGVVPCTPTLEQPYGDPLPSGNCPTGTVESPAAASGLQPGDVIVAVEGQPVSQWDEITSWIRDHGGQQAVLTVQRDGAVVEVPVQVASVDRPVVDEQGNLTDQTVQSGFIGLRPEFAYVSQGWSSVPSYMWDITVRSVEGLISLPVRVYELVSETLIGGGERAVDGPVSVVGVSRLGGEIAAMDEPFEAKAATFLGLAASLNLFLFLFNLLPILP